MPHSGSNLLDGSEYLVNFDSSVVFIYLAKFFSYLCPHLVETANFNALWGILPLPVSSSSATAGNFSTELFHATIAARRNEFMGLPSLFCFPRPATLSIQKFNPCPRFDRATESMRAECQAIRNDEGCRIVLIIQRARRISFPCFESFPGSVRQFEIDNFGFA